MTGGAGPGPSRSPGRLAKGARKRTAILDAVVDLLGEMPVAELSVEAVTERAGLKRSSFYFYFESKYVAVAAALSRVWDEMAAVADLGMSESWQGDVADGAEAVIALWHQHEGILAAMVEASHVDDGAREIWSAWLDRFVAVAAARIEAARGDAPGAAPPGAPTSEALARALVLMSERVLYDCHRRNAGPEQRAETGRALAATLAGVFAVYGVR